MINKNEDLKCMNNLKGKYFNTIYENSVSETERAIKNEVGEIIYYGDIVEDGYENKGYEVQVKESETKCKGLLRDSLPADFISNYKALEVRFGLS